MSIKYKRVMLKISGEALAGEKGFGLDSKTITTIAKKIKEKTISFDENVEDILDYWLSRI